MPMRKIITLFIATSCMPLLAMERESDEDKARRLEWRRNYDACMEKYFKGAILRNCKFDHTYFFSDRNAALIGAAVDEGAKRRIPKFKAAANIKPGNEHTLVVMDLSQESHHGILHARDCQTGKHLKIPVSGTSIQNLGENIAVRQKYKWLQKSGNFYGFSPEHRFYNSPELNGDVASPDPQADSSDSDSPTGP